MKVKLGDQDSHLYFKYKIGDKVHSKYGPSGGVVIGGDCYPDPEFNAVYYTVKMPNGRIETYRQNDIELVHIKLSH